MFFYSSASQKNFVTTSVDYVFNWARKSSLWPLTFGLACCAIEMIASSTSRFDIARFGAEVFRPSPRQSDLMIVAGTVTLKMAPGAQAHLGPDARPKWCISMGACSSVGGPFNTYAVLQGVDKIVPVDVYITGCPPRPENLFYGLLKLQDKIDQMTTLVKRPTEVRLDETMLEDFKKQVRIAQMQNPGVTSCSTRIPGRSTASANWTRSLGWCTASARACADIPAPVRATSPPSSRSTPPLCARPAARRGVLGEGDALLENTPRRGGGGQDRRLHSDPAGG